MTSFYDSHDYYKKMLELQEKLRKSEEERIRLEERFKVLLQESRNRHNTCINRLRFKYIEFLEEQRMTDERNHKLLAALDRVDNSLALMTARTDRLNSLRKHYEAYLRGICTVRTDDADDIFVHQSNKYVRTEQRNSLLPEARSTLPLRSSWTNNQPIKSSFLSPSKLTKSTQNISCNNASSNIVDLRTSGQQINNDQSVVRTCPKHLQHDFDFEQLPTFHLLSPKPVFQQSQEYNNNVRFEARDCQTDPKLQSLHANTSMLRAVPHLSMPYYINGNKSLDISQNQTSESIFQYPINPPCMQSFPLQQSNEIPFDHVQRGMKTDNFQNAPKTGDARNISNTPFLNESLNFGMNPHTNYLNYSSDNNEHDKNYITGTFPMYTCTNHINARQLSKGTRETHTEEDEEDQVISMTTNNSEFDRYIDRIRKLHHDLDKQSSEEDRHRHDANSNSLNATVLNDDSEMSVKEKLDESLTNQVKQVLELAENLVARTMNMNGTKCVEQAEKPEQNEQKLDRNMQSCTSVVSERNHVKISDAHEGHVTSSMTHAKDRISNDIALHQLELDSHENIEKSKNQNFTCIDGVQEQRKQQCLSELQIDNSVDFSQDNRIYIADESKLEQCLFSVSEELEPWNLNCVQKQVKEIDLINDIQLDQTVEKDLMVEEPASDETKLMQIEPINIGDNQLDKNEEAQYSESVQEVMLNDTSSIVKSLNRKYFEVSETKDQDDEISPSELRTSGKEDASSLNTENRLQNVELPNTENMSYNVELSNTENILGNVELSDNKYVEQKDYDDNNDKKYNESNDELDINEGNTTTNITLDEKHSNQDYKDSDQAKEYSNLNEEYNYDQNESYEYNKKEEYEGYVNHEYPQETNEQYEGYTSEQYDQYMNNSENIYENDPNVQYQEDTNQKYSYPYNKQYNSNSNEEFVANENQQYEPKEAEIPQEHEHEHETKEEDSEEYIEDQRESENQGKEDVLKNVDEDQSEKLPLTNEKKKVKDVIKSLLDTDTDSTLEQNISTTESDFDFN